VSRNAYDERNENGLLVHRYGPHIFHTNSQKIWNYLSRFTRWRAYSHHVLGVIDGRMVPIPFQLNTLYALFPQQRAERVREMLVARFGMGCEGADTQAARNAGCGVEGTCRLTIYEKIFLHYTQKQWGRRPEELDPASLRAFPSSSAG